jgi:hypothetical protein
MSECRHQSNVSVVPTQIIIITSKSEFVYQTLLFTFIFSSEISENIKFDVATFHRFDGTILCTGNRIISVVEMFCQQH